MEPPLTGGQVLDEVAYLATVEHALLVDHLLFRYAVGAGIEDVIGSGPAADRLAAAASTADVLSLQAMRRLHEANNVLVAAGRAPSVGRATHVVPEAGAAIAVASFTLAQFDGFPRRYKSVAAAVDRRYQRLEAAVASPVPGLDPKVAQSIGSFASGSGEHAAGIKGVVGDLGTLKPSDFLRVTRTVAADDGERRLLAASDGYYHAVVAAVVAIFGDDENLGDLLQGQTVSTMNALEGYNGHLVKARLLPSFTLPA